MKTIQVGKTAILAQGDCLERMKEIPAGSVDMILADPPFGTTRNKWDIIIPLELMWERIWKCLKPNGVVVLCASQPFTSILISSQIEHFKTEWVWIKNKGSGHLNAKKMPMKFHETLQIFYKQKPNYNPQMTDGHKEVEYAQRGKHSENYGKVVTGYYKSGTKRHPRNVLEIPVVNNDGTGDGRYHPTQKPVALMEYFIRTYSNENEIILDFTMGSGSTGVAAKNLNRKFIGIEIGETHFNTAVKRISEL
jgi:DNA modification methylase